MFKKIETSKKFIKYSECQKGDIIAEGIYKGAKEGKYGLNHEFKPEVGPIVSLNGAGHLNWLLAEYATVGQAVQVTYAGKEKLEKGAMVGKLAHRFELAVDDSTPVQTDMVDLVDTKEDSLDLNDLD